uniref:Up-regulated during septation protein 1 domain-containing protein n=1 Tax=Chromera velia CCMP2878 TaxID=1169474 RepID=A0A0G4GAH9_9ALVE|eukprot:Cvel_4393.t1-p1 / transcript=Cvel_4393.t1 / gene=Cvel_4393 / organism=Chromera_velia_CCMP2878 / gene_product=hypothetical protein / transcript_product=hypothetical protein / location=Cvel_scaffold191:8765-11523(+) / protein_length=746 / sequence_SO=supercontig / SO=protein_coding / is_pseudo=false
MTFLVFCVLCLCVCVCSGQTAVQKVVETLRYLHEKVSSERDVEEVSFARYDSFCTNNGDAQRDEVSRTKQEIETLDKELRQLSDAQVEIKLQRETAASELLSLQEQLQAEQTKRETGKTEYLKKYTSVTKGLDALKIAISRLEASLKISSSLSLLQRSSSSSSRESLSSALQEGHRLLRALKKEESGESREGGDSDSVLQMLKTLQSQFEEKRESIQREEAAALHIHEQTLKQLRHSAELKEQHISRRDDEIKWHDTLVATKSAELASLRQTVSAVQASLSALDAECESKRKLMEERREGRTRELTGLAGALHIVETKILPLDPSAESSVSPSVSLAQTDTETESSISVSSLGERGSPTRTVAQKRRQINSHRRELSLHPGQTSLSDAVSLLRQNNDRETNSIADALASSLVSDEGIDSPASLTEAPPGGSSEGGLGPARSAALERVRQMMRELIGRLEKQAREEESHKQWCDTQTSRLEGEKKALHSKLREGASLFASMTAEIEALAGEKASAETRLQALKRELEEAGALRLVEQSENEQAQADAREGAGAVEEAKGILSAFLDIEGGAGGTPTVPPSVLLSQVKEHTQGRGEEHRGRNERAPASPFEGPYRSVHTGTPGVLDMLHVVKTEFLRAAQEASNAEAAASVEHSNFEQKMQKEIAEKEGLIEQRKADLDESKTAVSKAESEISSQREEMTKILEEAAAVSAACVGGGETSADRIERREDQIESLRASLDILRAHEGVS